MQDDGLKDISPGLRAILEAVQARRIAQEQVETRQDNQYKIPNFKNYKSKQQATLIKQYRAQGWQ